MNTVGAVGHKRASMSLSGYGRRCNGNDTIRQPELAVETVIIGRHFSAPPCKHGHAWRILVSRPAAFPFEGG